MTRVLVTGSRGFTGQYVVEALARAGWSVIGSGPQSGAEDESNFVRADLTSQDDAQALVRAVRPDVVIHLAAVAFVGESDAEAFYRVNLLGTRNLLASLARAKHSPTSVLLASSANIYGNQTGGALNEDADANPANDYAVSKLAMEYMARTWLDYLPITIVRPFNYTGRGQASHFLLPKIVEHFRARSPQIELGNLDVWRDFSDVRAVAEAYVGLLAHRAEGKVFNICSGRLFSLREILAIAERVTGHEIEVRVNPAFVRNNEVETLCGDPSRLQALLTNWTNPPLEETLRWMLDPSSPC